MDKGRLFKARGTNQQEELRRRREDVAVEIRKQKRDEQLSKRRNLQLVAGAHSDSEDENHAPGGGPGGAQVGSCWDF